MQPNNPTPDVRIEVTQTPVQESDEEAEFQAVPRTKQRLLRGVYKILSQNRDLVYVGSSTCLDNRRAAHNTSVLLGGRMEIIELLPNATRRELASREDYYIMLYRAEGMLVVNGTNEEAHLARWGNSLGRRTKEEMVEAGRQALAVRTLDQRREAGRRSGEARRLKARACA